MTLSFQLMNYKLRPWTLQDVTPLTRYANNMKIADRLTDKFPHPYTEEDARSFINAVSEQDPLTLFAIEVDEEAVGSIGLIIQEDIWCKNAELGYWLAEHLWGKGIMTLAILDMVNFLQYRNVEWKFFTLAFVPYANSVCLEDTCICLLR